MMRPGRAPRRRSRLRLVLIAVAGVLVAIVVALVGLVAVTAIAADQGAETPNVAAYKVLVALDHWQELGDADKFLCEEDREAMRARLAELRNKLETVLGSYAVVIETGEAVTRGEDEATVTAAVGVNWTPPGSIAYRSEQLSWTFTTRRVGFPTGGWKVCAFTGPTACDYVRCE